jgi:septum formation protein
VTAIDSETKTRDGRLILGSGSPRRKELLERAGFDFTIDPAGVEERPLPDETAFAMTLRLAVEKASAVAARSAPGDVALGADTTVVLDGEALGKPAGTGDAARMLLRLAGRDHRVLTAWALVEAPGGGRAVAGIARSVVTMREISAREAAVYAAGGEPLDKAGAYAVQGEGRRLIGAVFGSLDNVIGLPVDHVRAALFGFGFAPGVRAS